MFNILKYEPRNVTTPYSKTNIIKKEKLKIMTRLKKKELYFKSEWIKDDLKVQRCFFEGVSSSEA